MTLQAAPHPVSVFRYLKQARRDYLVSGNAQTLVVNTVPGQAAAAGTVVTGTVTVDLTVNKPVTVFGRLFAGAVLKSTVSAVTNSLTGAYTLTFPGALLVAGPAHVDVFNFMGTTTSNTFTVT